MERYRQFVCAYQKASSFALPAPKPGAFRALKPARGGPVALLFSPHPDDEVITGTLPLRLQHEAGARVVNIAVTLGSQPSRRAARRRELAAACALLGWENEVLGWEQVTLETGRRKPAVWKRWVGEIASIIARWQPRWIFYPHAHDWHPAHRGVNLLVETALKKAARPTGSPPWRILTEYWHPLAEPNLLVECPPKQLAQLVAALCCHRGEIVRNPYHRTLPAWMLDSVRRGAERVASHGAPAPKLRFGTLYRVEPARPPQWSAVLPAKKHLRG